MLRSIHDSKKINKNFHSEGIRQIRKAFGEERYLEIEDWVVSHFDKSDWFCTTFEAPAEWKDTPLMPIWDYYASIQDYDARHQRAAMAYGAICYTILFDRPEMYEFHRADGHHSDDKRPFGLTYRKTAP